MVDFTFKPRFVEPIRARTKIQTIRKAARGRLTKVGGPVRMATGSRFKPILFGEALCTDCGPIHINLLGDRIGVNWLGRGSSESFVGAVELDAFAQTDGFLHWADMRAFWKAEHGTVQEFEGWLTRWGDTFVALDSPGRAQPADPDIVDGEL